MVQYFDTIIYRGDDSVDSDTCKIHTQLHNRRSHAYFGDLMQYNSAIGERGLKVWAKRVSQTALKHGRDKFTYSTSSRVGERMLLDTITDRLRMQEQSPTNLPTSLESHSRRRMPHFRYSRDGSSNVLMSLDRKGKESPPDDKTGTIQLEILEGIFGVEINGHQTFFDIWCEAKLQNGQYIRCWPQYRSGEGIRYDWAMMSFGSEEEDAGGQPIIYPAKVLALYEDSEGTLKALVHSVEYKTATNVEGPFGDSRLVKHYRLEFQGNGKPRMYSVPVDKIRHVIVAYEAIRYADPLVPRVRSLVRQKEHTMMTILPRSQWAKLFVDWTKELRDRRNTVNGDDKYRLDWSTT